jgi:hypothetical protein
MGRGDLAGNSALRLLIQCDRDSKLQSDIVRAKLLLRANCMRRKKEAERSIFGFLIGRDPRGSTSNSRENRGKIDQAAREKH